jgi:hypothetical protein
MRWIVAASLSLVFWISLAPASSAQVSLYVTPTNQDGEILTFGAPLLPGDQISFDIAARSPGADLAALGVSALSYEASGLQFVSGSGVPQLFAAICVPDVGCFGGLEGSTGVRGSLSESNGPSGRKVQIFNHLSLSPATATGEGDWGPNGVVGEAQARVTFSVTGFGGSFRQDETIAIGSFFEAGDALVLYPIGDYGTVETIWVVPEPGTAVLLGLGLIGLAARRHRG